MGSETSYSSRFAIDSVCNTRPADAHDRRVEAVPSPSWSIRSGAGTSNHAFVRAMAGDKVDCTEFGPVSVGGLR